MKPKLLKSSLIIFLIIIFCSAIVYFIFFEGNVNLKANNKSYVYIPSGSDFGDLKTLLAQKKILKDTSSFYWLAKLLDFKKVHAGRYEIYAGMSNWKLIKLFKTGRQTPVRISFNSTRTIEELAARIAQKLEVDSAVLLKLLNNDKMLSGFGFNHENVLSMFIPDTYEFYWNTNSKQFVDKMYREFQRFWSENRRTKAKALGLTPIKVSILASIVQAEQLQHYDEQPTIAGLYINRLKKGMLLQSDPTIIYALKNFSLKRVLSEDKNVESPYNTYKFVGLPPGPINIPEKSSIDAVLNYKHHDYIYMCAKDDLKGYHNFAKTIDQHNINAIKYQRALNRRNILR